MPASFRTQRVSIFSHSSSGSQGVEGDTYTRVHSADADFLWRASKESARAGERAIAAQLGHELDTTFGFGMEAVTALTPDGQIRHGTEWYAINSILPAVRLPELVVNAVRMGDAPVPTSVVE